MSSSSIVTYTPTVKQRDNALRLAERIDGFLTSEEWEQFWACIYKHDPHLYATLVENTFVFLNEKTTKRKRRVTKNTTKSEENGAEETNGNGSAMPTAPAKKRGRKPASEKKSASSENAMDETNGKETKADAESDTDEAGGIPPRKKRATAEEMAERAKLSAEQAKEILDDIESWDKEKRSTAMRALTCAKNLLNAYTKNSEEFVGKASVALKIAKFIQKDPKVADAKFSPSASIEEYDTYKAE